MLRADNEPSNHVLQPSLYASITATLICGEGKKMVNFHHGRRLDSQLLPVSTGKDDSISKARNGGQ